MKLKSPIAILMRAETGFKQKFNGDQYCMEIFDS